jgi:hypothetical protein
MVCSRGLYALAVLFASQGCSSEQPSRPPEDVIEAVLFESTKELTRDDLDGLAPDRGDGELVFAPAPAALSSVAPGDVLLAGVSPSTPYGLLRVVRSVDRKDGTLTLQTFNAPVQLAFKRLRVDVSRSVPSLVPEGEASELGSLAARALPGPAAPGDSITETRRFDFALFDGDDDPETRDDRVELSGELGGTLDYRMHLDFDWGSIEELPQAVEDCITSIVELEVDCSFDSLLPAQD